jgi:hypothetical protein
VLSSARLRVVYILDELTLKKLFFRIFLVSSVSNYHCTISLPSFINAS